ncbi:MAG TPA: hypothetical protein VHT27_08055 [Solirubrobacteraceae bacterium]|jgi:hypothetical protein|nr:hypothetical protein [Solirubrobacteraceae bacterium]
MIDVHQHLWTEPLVERLAARHELPFVRLDGCVVLHLAGERPYVIDLAGEAPGQRAKLVAADGLDRALVCLSSPLGIEWLPREDACPLLDAYHDGALALGEPFGVWGAVPLAEPDPDDVDRALQRGCTGITLPSGALADAAALGRVHGLLERLALRGAPLLVHPGPAGGAAAPSLEEPLWWPALTGYVAGMQAAWLTFATACRPALPRLRVVFAMLAGLAPLHAERLRSRGGPAPAPDPLTFYETSSYGPVAVRAMADAVGEGQLLYGSDRPVADPADLGMPAALDRGRIAAATERALAPVEAPWA